MCGHVGGAASSGGANVSANLGIANAGSEISTRKKKRIRAKEEDRNTESVKGASADEGGWGFLVAPQYGKSTRTETDLENGFQSNLKGLLAGADYRFSDEFVLGTALSHIKDSATFFNNAGSMETGNTVLNLYATWLPADSVAVDGYLGYGKITFDSRRVINWVTNPPNGFFGTVSGSTTGQQTMAGMSASLQSELAGIGISPAINLDYIKTRINGYDESGTTTIEMHYGDRDITSLTGSVGVRLGSSHGFDWGELLPNLQMAAVHEFQNNSQQIQNELVITPGSGFLVATDAPDRNYFNVGFGVTAALYSGAQFFLDYEKRTQDKLLNSWAVSLGGLFEF